jgi:PAS domain S-box-containing protein
MYTLLPPSLYESAFESNQTGNYLLSPTPEAVILAVNGAFLRASGRRREELVGMSLFDAFPGNPDDAEDTGEQALRASIVRVIETRQPNTLPVQRYPITVQLPDGRMAYEERFWSAVNTPVFDADGELVCISHTTTDITDKVRAERALRESERRYRALVSATADVIYRMGPDWSELRQLQGRGFLRDTEDASRFWLDEYIPPEERARVHAAADEAIRGKKVFELEHRVRRTDGSQGWVLSRAAPMLDDQGAIYEWIGAASDITERKLAEEKLLEADRRKDEFLAMLAHELRNPLAPISAAASLLQTGRLGVPRVQETSRIIGRQVTHMTSLVDDLLDVSRVTCGKIDLDRVPLDVGDILEDAIEQIGPQMAARRHRLERRLAPGLGVCGDRKRLVQVFANLLGNAAKYTPEGGCLRVATTLDGDCVAIDVADNGIGMTPDMVVRAFDLFVQAERPADRSLGGLGLGLPLVRSLVELHGGSVSCASAGPGHGSRFSVRLPQLAEPAPPTRGAFAGQNDGADGHGRRVLVVDDNVDAASMLGMLLAASGYDVQVEHDGAHAIGRARAWRPDVFLLDIGLPGMDGYELARRLRAQPHTANAMLVAVTGYGQEGDRERTGRAGFDHHLVKPVDFSALRALIERAARRAAGAPTDSI